MRTIIFDMDGTLINSGNIIADTINYVRQNLGLPPLEKMYLLENVNNPNIHPPEFFYGSKTYLPQHIKLFEEYYCSNLKLKIELYDGILELLEALRDTYSLVIATNANKATAVEMLTHLNIYHYFQMVVGADEVKSAKPYPDMIEKIIFDMNIDKKKAVVIGDSHKDMMAAKAAGVDSLLVNWGFTNHKDAIVSINELKRRLLAKY